MKYLAKAFGINANNPITNNAMGYMYYYFYKKYPEKFVSLETLKLSDKDLTKKIIGFYKTAITLDPNFKIAYGNLYKIYSEDYNTYVKEALCEIHGLNIKDYSSDATLKGIEDSYYNKACNSNGWPQYGIIPQ